MNKDTRGKEEKAYEALLDALQYRRYMLMERLKERYLPNDLREENEERLRKLEEWRDILFT